MQVPRRRAFFTFTVLVGLFLLAGCNSSRPQDTLEGLAATSVVAGINAYNYYGDPAKIVITQVPVTGQVFTRAWRVVSGAPFAQPYESQLYATNSTAITKGDQLFILFWARALNGATAQTEFAFESDEASGFAKSVLAGVTFGPDWKFFQLPFIAGQDFAVGTASAVFRLGYNNQNFELAGLRISNYGKTLATASLRSKGFEYPGIATDAAWRTAANARIEQYRKGNINVNVVNSAGQSVSGATVKVEMQRHAFPFGSAIATPTLFDNLTYQQKVFELFNRVVLEYELKWTEWGYAKPNALRAIALMRQRGVSVRGHNLVWPIKELLPPDLPTDPAGIRARIDEHLVDILGATKGQLIEWDVVNEPSANKYLQDILGEDEMAQWFIRTKQLDPAARLFINDYGNLGEGTLDVEYTRIIRRLLELGAPVQGIGLQGHFNWDLTPPEELYNRLTAYSRLGPTLAITEFDVNIADEYLQANYLRDALTIAFSHPKVSSFLMWGFWEGQHWQPQAALYRLDWSIKPNGRVWNDLIFRQWWTNVTGTTNTSGAYSARGFFGRYKITVSKNGKTTSQTVNAYSGTNTFQITLPQ